MNPCRCGYLSDPSLACSRAPRRASDYQAKISGPLFDRIDIHVDVPAVSPGDLTLPPPAEGSAEIAARVKAARQRQRACYIALGKDGGGNGATVRTNADLSASDQVRRIHIAEAVSYRRVFPGR
ncbi:MAG: ATP-binding protein [Proteobacteria bacterium]|nr:ATP-binding protein [Pseudomonadota bacterium]